ncbi:hypothetical protein QYF61_006200 [Mycteria americana]|uniref:Reverse transcriptase n=1 Tax=Mycteria americana TaxID=33587 RepID=A0AAN7MXS2_MYCAM|nr:hypothetical protein QYF61_006200 [Mycteria americana]
MGPDGLRPWTLRKLADFISRLLPNTFGRSWQLGEVAEDWRKANVTPILKGKKEDLGNYRLVSLTLIPRRVMKQLILEIISKHMKNKNAIGSSQHRFMKGNLLKFNKVKCAPEEQQPHAPVHTGTA